MTKHFKDSLYCSNYIPKNASVADVGSGAGFPGIPLKIARPDISLTIFEATGKKITFLNHLCNKLNIDVKCIHIRAEDAGGDIKYREQFDIAVSRAVARMSILAEYCLPLVRVGGKMVAMKGSNVDGEITQAAGLIKKLGAEVLQASYYIIEGTDIKHSIVEVEKKMPTPMLYPRRGTKIGR